MQWFDGDGDVIDFTVPIFISPRVECLKCGRILSLSENNWCTTCRRIMALTYSTRLDDNLRSEGCQDYMSKQKAEVIPHVVDVERWPEVEPGTRRLSSDAWRQLYAQGYAGIPRDYRKRLRPNVRKLIVESLPKAA